MQTHVVVNDVKRILNLKPSRAIQQDWGYQGQRLPGFPKPAAARVNLLPENWMPFDQLDTGTCAGNAFSGLYYCMTGVILSRLQLWINGVMTDEWDATVPGCLQDGTSLKAILEYARKVGAVPEELWPFWPLQSWYKGSGEELLDESKKHRIDSFYYLGKDPDLWKLWMSNYGALYLGILVDGSYQFVGTVGVLDTFQSNSVRGGHAKFGAGYGILEDMLHTPMLDRIPKGLWKQERFILPGSWGSNFGHGGKVYATTDWMMAAATEIYGVIVNE